MHDNTEMQTKPSPERVDRPRYNRHFWSVGSQAHVTEFRGDKQIIARKKKKLEKKKHMQLSGGTVPLNKTVSILSNRW